MQTYKLLSNDTVLLSQPELVKHFGRSGAQLLSQLHYWLSKKQSMGCKYQNTIWIYNSAEEWAGQLQLSVRHVRRLVAEFVKLGIVRVAKLNKIKTVRTNYYSINYEQLKSFIDREKPCSPCVSGDKMSPSSCQNDMIYIQKKTSKDFNKSELPQNFDREGNCRSNSKSQVKLVNDLNLKTKIKTSTAQDMLKIWNKFFIDKAEAKLSKELAPLLVAAFKNKFANNLKNWEEYCWQIKSSTYLMGESFKLTINWALKFTTIERIRAGELGVKSHSRIGEESTILGQTHREQQIEHMIESLGEPQSAKALRYKIIKAIGHNAYYSWFHLAKFYEGEEGIQLVAPNPFVAQYWETHFEWVHHKVSMSN